MRDRKGAAAYDPGTTRAGLDGPSVPVRVEPVKLPEPEPQVEPEPERAPERPERETEEVPA